MNAHIGVTFALDMILNICLYQGFLGLAICGSGAAAAALAAFVSTPQVVSAEDFFGSGQQRSSPRFSQQSVAGLRDCLELCPLWLFILLECKFHA